MEEELEASAIAAVEALDLGGTAPDFSFFGMFAQADFIVQAVMIMLLGAWVSADALLQLRVKLGSRWGSM
jgi:hypothetical protein